MKTAFPNRIVTLVLIAVLGTSAGPARGDLRTSTNYTVATEVLDSGGRPSTSPNYRNLGSLNNLAGHGVTSSNGTVVASGFFGQLFEVANVAVIAPTNMVNEIATLQLTATATLDDATFAILPSRQAGWSVVSGPIAGIDPNGLATAGAVYQDTAATVQAVFGAQAGRLGLTVLDTLPDNFGSYAGDGLPDAWQIQYFGLKNPLAAPGADPDRDGENNLFEYLAGTVPTNAASRFELTISAVPGPPQRTRLTFSPRVTNRVYSVYFRTNLHTGSLAPLTNGILTDLGTVRTVTDTNANGPVKFYQVRIALP